MAHPARTLPREVANDALFGRWLRAQGLKLTPHRAAVLRALRAAPAPLSAEALAKQIPQAHLVTLYRTLETFARAGVVRTVGLEPERARFELNFDHHHHIVCTSCERVEGVRLKDKALERAALRGARNFRTISRHTLEFFGLCKSCAKT
jgi:Fur family transcriptional regulator, peroxide stress response regulator